MPKGNIEDELRMWARNWLERFKPYTNFLRSLNIPPEHEVEDYYAKLFGDAIIEALLSDKALDCKLVAKSSGYGYLRCGDIGQTSPFRAGLPHYVGSHGDRFKKPALLGYSVAPTKGGNLQDPEETRPSRREGGQLYVQTRSNAKEFIGNKSQFKEFTEDVAGRLEASYRYLINLSVWGGEVIRASNLSKSMKGTTIVGVHVWSYNRKSRLLRRG